MRRDREGTDLSPVERAFSTKQAAPIIVFDIAGGGYSGYRSDFWSLTYKYRQLFGNTGEVKVRPARNVHSLDEFVEQFREEREEFGAQEDSFHFRYIKEREAQYMAGVLFSPPMDLARTQERQRIIEAFVDSPDLDTLIRLKNQAFRLVEGVQTFNSSYSSHGSDERSLVQMLGDGETTVRQYDYEWAAPWDYEGEKSLLPYARDALRAINQGIEALNVLSSRQEPALSASFGDLPHFISNTQRTLTDNLQPEMLEAVLKKGDEVSPNDKQFVAWLEKAWLWDDGLRDLQDDVLEPYLYGIGSALEFAQKIKNEGWAKVTFDPGKPVDFEQGWNLEKRQDRQVKNDSPADTPVAILSGANTSGKSFAMKSDFLIRIAGQSLGFAPASAANLRPYESFVYLDRSATDSSNDLSAFTREVQNWKIALPWIGPNTRLYVDEGFSTTSPQDQARLLLATAEYIRGSGGSVMLATHNDMVLDAATGNPNMHIYHLAADVGANGELIRHFLLEPGKSESLSFAVARTKDFPANALRWAEAYYNRRLELPVPQAIRVYPSVEVLPKEEREKRKVEIRSLDHLFPSAPVNSIFHLFSVDPDFQTERFLQYTSHKREERVMDFLSLGTQKELLSKMMLWGSELASQDIAERQRLISELLREGVHQTLHDAIVEAMALESDFAVLKHSTKDGFKGLNPFPKRDEERRSWDRKIESSNPPFSKEGLQRAIAFLRIQQKLSGSDFQYANLLSQFTNLATIYEQASKRAGKNQDLSKVELSEDEQVLLLLSLGTQGEEGLSKTKLTLGQVERVIEKLFGRLQAVGKELPSISFRDINPDEIKEELNILKDQGGVAATLEALPQHIESARTLIDLLRSVDSVYLHQAANFLEQQLDKNIAVLKGETNEDEIPQEDEGQKDKLPVFDHIGRRGGSIFGLISDYQREKRSPFGNTLEQLDALCLFADIAKKEGYTPVKFNTTGEVQLRDAFSIFKKKKDEVKNTVYLDPENERIQLLTGPNGSGKTFYEKGAIAAIMMGLTTGYAPAEFATMPIFDGVAYLDRVTERQGDQFSAFSQEVEYWKKLLALAKDKKTVFAAVDEAFSTTSPTYQAAFTFGVVADFLQSQHFLLLATHNHDVVNYLQQTGVALVNPYHFQFSAENGRVQYQYKLQEGHETSHAVEVARTMELPKEITDPKNTD